MATSDAVHASATTSLPAVAKRVLQRFEWPIVIALLLAYGLTYGALSVLRHESYHSLGADLGLFDQIFWNTVHGRWWESTMSEGLPSPHLYFGDHFSPIFFLVLPFYWIWPHPETLLIIQTAFLTAGAIPIYLLARAILPAGAHRVLWAVAYFLFLPVAYVNLFDFHETALAVLPLGLSLYFLERRQLAWFLAALASTFLIKEEMPLIGLAFGAYALLGKRLVRLGCAVMIGSLAAFLAVIELVIPAFAGGHAYVYFGSRYPQLGNTLPDVLRTILVHPLRVIRLVAQPAKARFIAALLAPLLGMSLWSGFAMLLLVPTFLYLLLSSYPPQYAFTSQYAAPLVPLILGTGILGFARLPVRARAWAAGGILLSSLVFSYAYGYLPYSRKFDAHLFALEPRYASFLPSLRQIPSTASVAAERFLTPHLDQRRFIYNLEFEGTQRADYVALDVELKNLAVFDTQVAAVRAQGYTEIASAPGLALLRRSALTP